MICDAGAVVVVPFPFVDIEVAKPRPALVLSSRAFNASEGQTLLAMITTAARSRWASDCAVTDLAIAGLKAESFVRLKLFTLENARIAKQAGRLCAHDLEAMRERVDQIMLPLEERPS